MLNMKLEGVFSRVCRMLSAVVSAPATTAKKNTARPSIAQIIPWRRSFKISPPTHPRKLGRGTGDPPTPGRGRVAGAEAGSAVGGAIALNSLLRCACRPTSGDPVSPPQRRGSTRRSRGRGARSNEACAAARKLGGGSLSPATSGEYPAEPGEGGPFERSLRGRQETRWKQSLPRNVGG